MTDQTDSDSKKVKVKFEKKIIDITKILKDRNPSVNQMGMEALQSLTQEEADAATAFIFNMVLTNVEIGLGTLDTDDPEIEKYIDEIEEEDMVFFEGINEIYKRSVRNCYFCRNDIDPNAEKIAKGTPICLICEIKLANFVEAVGLPKNKVFPLQRVRKESKQ